MGRGGQAIGLGLAGLAGLEIGRAFLALFSPIVIDYCEMMVAGATEQLKAGGLREMYAPPLAPYGMPGVQYPPLFILLTALFTASSGLGLILAERLLAWSLYVGSGLLVGLIVWQETRQRWAAIIAATLPFCFWSVIIYLHAARVDPLALFLSLLAAYFYRRLGNKARSLSGPGLGLVAGLAVAAFFTKQTYLAVSAAVFFDLLLSNPAQARPRRSERIKAAGLFAALWLGWAGAGFALFGFLSGGEMFGIYEPARAGSFIFDRVPAFIAFFVLDHLPLLLLAAFALRRRRQLKSGTFWPLYSLFAALACVTIIKDGAVDYYFNELAYVLCVVIGAGAWGGSGRGGKKEILLGVQVVIALAMFVGWSHWKDFDLAAPPYRAGLALVREAQAEEARGGKPALVLVDSFLLETGRARQVGDYFIYSVLLSNGKRDLEPLLADVETGRYGLIVTENFLRLPVRLEAALANRYNLSLIMGDDGRKPYWVYRRLPSTP